MKTIIKLDEFVGKDSEHLVATNLVCPVCGAWHTIPFGRMIVGTNVIDSVVDKAGEILGSQPKKAVVIYDRRIEGFISANVLQPLATHQLKFDPLPLGRSDGLLEAEDTIGDQAAERIDSEVDFIIGVGSGVICDLTKWIATRLGKPFILCGTAPSMNAYTSITASITENGIKKSETLNPADAVMADVNLMRQAPIPMIRAGMGDLSARAICNADWRLSNLLRRTYFCPVPYQMTAKSEKAYLAAAEGIGRAEPESIQILTEAIMVSGLSMTILGENTSPSSGGEHILSHFWDLLVHLRGVPKNLHGAQVGVGTIIMLNLYDYMRRYDIRKIDPARILRNRPTLEAIETENRRLYGSQADSFNRVTRQKRIPDGDFVNYVRGILDRWDELWEALSPYIASLESIRRPFETAGVILALDGIQRTRGEGIEALCNGIRYRPRYTLLDLASELGILPGDAEIILDRAGV